MRQIKSVNINLRNDIAQANERTLNVKNNFQKLQQQLVGLRAEQEGQRKLLQRQEGVVKAQQAVLQDNKEETNGLRNLLSSTSSALAALQGKLSSLSSTLGDRLDLLEPGVASLTSEMHDLTSNTTSFRTGTSGRLLAFEEASRLQAEAIGQVREDLGKNMVAVRDIVTKLDGKLQGEVDSQKQETRKVERRVLEAVSSLNNRVEGNSVTIVTLNGDLKEAATKLSMIKQEIENSVSYLTTSMERNVTATMAELEAATSKVEDNVASLASKSSQLSNEMNKLRSHAQRSVDTSSGVKVNLGRLEGRVAEVAASATGIVDRVKQLEGGVEQSRERQIENLRSIQRLGDNLASLRSDIAGKDLKGGLGDLLDKALALEKSVAELSVKAVQSEQDVVRNSGRINKVEQDFGNIRQQVADLTEDQDMFEKNSNKKINAVTASSDSVREKIEALEQTVTTTRNAVAEVMTKQASLEASGSGGPSSAGLASTVATLKTNVIGLGNYINSINREVNSLASRTKESVENLNNQVVQLTSSVSKVKMDQEELGAKVSSTNKKSALDLDNDDFLTGTSSVKTEIASLSSQVFTLKTTVFELSTDFTGVRSGLQSVNSEVKTLKGSFKDLSNKVISGEQTAKATRDQLSSVRNSVSGLSSSLFALRSNIKTVGDVENEVNQLARNMTSLSSAVGKLRPEVDFLATDVTSVRDGVGRVTRALKLMSDPPRFSCGVTGEELKVSGVISYDECTVNFSDMMNKGTGHATAPAAGDYMLSFTANMVSSDSQAIWCALYKQSPGDEGWQVLGMINNYQRDAGDEDDRDSGSLSLLASLAEGDQVWVEWRGYGESFLYSNPYKLISFTGYLVTRAS